MSSASSESSCTDSSGDVVISSSILYKYGIDSGDVITLNDDEEGKIYAFNVTNVTQYSPTFIVFMDYDKAIELFGEPDDYFNVVFSDHALDIDSGRLYSTTTKSDIEKSAGIFSDMMQSMVNMIGAIVSIPLSKLIMDAIYEPAFCPNVACGINKTFPWWIYVGMFAAIIILYFIINHLLIRRIRKAVPADVLKNRE